VNRPAQGVLLLLVGAAVLRAGTTDLYLRYVRTGLRPLLLGAGVVLIVAALTTFWYERRARHAAPHAHREPRVAWLLLLPMLVLLLLAPPALGSFSAARSGTALGAAPASDQPPLPEGDPVRLSMMDYASRAVYDNGRSLAGRHLTLSGFVLPGDGGTWYLTRMVITCCAADAQPIKVGLTGTVPGRLKANDWIQVTGSYATRKDRDPVNQEPIPYLSVESSTPIPAPARQYES